MAELDDDLDWLYRRGRYADPDAARPPSSQPESTRVQPAAVQASPTASAAPRTPGVQTTGVQALPRTSGTRQAPRAQQSPSLQRARAQQPRNGAPAARTPRSRVKRVLAVLGLLLAAFLVYLIAVPVSAWSGLQHVAYEPAGTRPEQQPGTLLLLAGSDSRDGLTSQQMHDLGTGSEGGNVADTVMLLWLPPSGKPALISVPRDSYVDIPGHGKNKINAAFSFGGPTLLTQTIEQNTGLRVDGYLGIGFGGFVSIIDAVGGIEQCPPKDINDDGAHLVLKAGCQNMNGVTALKYVRYRHADPLGDLGRAQRQRAMVAAVAKKAASPASVLNPFTYVALNKAGASALKAGNGTDLGQIAPASWGFVQIAAGQGRTLQMPVSNAAFRTGKVGQAVLWDAAKSQQLVDAIKRGDAEGLAPFEAKK